jgi:hypothetical protein
MMRTLVLAAAATVLLSRCSLVTVDSCTKPHSFRQFDWAPPPTAEERVATASLPPAVQAAVNRHLLGPQSAAALANPADPRAYPILAVRANGRYLMLHVRGLSMDGDRYLVYSPRLECVVGEFGWMAQG